MFAIEDVPVLGQLPAGLSLELLVMLAALCWVLCRLVRVWSRRRLAEQGCWFEVRLAEETKRNALEVFLRTLAHGLPRRWLRVGPWVLLSIYGDEQHAICGLFVSGGIPAAQVRSGLEQTLGGASVLAAKGPPLDVVRASVGQHRFAAGVAHSSSRYLPLRSEHKVDPAGQMLAGLTAQARGEGGVIQVFIQAPSRLARGRALSAAGRLRNGERIKPHRTLRIIEVVGRLVIFLLDEAFSGGKAKPPPLRQRQASAFAIENARAIERKAKEPLLAVSVRFGGWAVGSRRAFGRLSGLHAALGQYHELSGLHGRVEAFAWRKLTASLPPLQPRLLLSTSETAAVLALPEQAADSPIPFAAAPSRRVAPVAEAPTKGMLLGKGDRAGFERDIYVYPRALLQHMQVMGPTGRGKSTLLLNLTLEAIRAGTGGMVLDPTGELTGLILSRIPESKAAKVDLLDLGEADRPPALNLLACRAQDGDVHVQALCGIFSRLYSRFWGPRTEDLFRSALSTLLVGRSAQHPVPTLADVLDLLANSDGRARHGNWNGGSIVLDQFWAQWRALSEPARVQALAPLANKLRSLLGQRIVANMLCQPAAPKFEQTIARGRWLIVSAPPSIGEDAADLIGSVLIYRAWQAARTLGPIAHSKRPPFLLLIDECHRFCRMPMDSALAQARGYGLGFILAHQHLAQFRDKELAEAVEANCQTKLCFALEPSDARRMAPVYAPRLDAYDLQHLGAHTIACRVQHEGRQLPTATAKTLPPQDSENGNTEMAIRQRAHDNSNDREKIEAAIRQRYVRISTPPQGRADADNNPDTSIPGGVPHDVPPHGTPPPAHTPLQHSDPAPNGFPDEHQQFPGR